jgi:hypothetical protein
MPDPTPPGCLPYKKLAWSDFPVRDSGGAPDELAAAHGKILYRFKQEWRETRRGAFEARVTELTFSCYFDLKRSWRRSRLPAGSDALLRHEQAHLDLTLLLQKRLSQTRPDSLEVGKGGRSEDAVADLEDKMRRWFDDQIEGNRKLQDQYDAETDHSRRAAAQQAWERKIAAALKQFPS